MSFVTLCNMKKISCLRLRFLKMMQVIFFEGYYTKLDV